MVAGCGDDGSTPAATPTQEPQPPSAPTPEPQPPGAPTPSVSLPSELVGTWATEQWLDQSGSQKIVRTYVFTPDGGYQYTIATCRSGDCAINGQESGYAQAAGGMLSLQPQTDSQEGPRGWPYVVDRDPVVGDVRLALTLPDGQTDIFYVG